jgi:hypothetical protein
MCVTDWTSNPDTKNQLYCLWLLSFGNSWIMWPNGKIIYLGSSRMDFLGFLSSHKMGTKCICGCLCFWLSHKMGIGYWLYMWYNCFWFSHKMILIHSSQILSLSLSLSLCARVLLGVLSSDSQEGGQRETKKRKEKRFPFFGCVCIQQILCFLQQQLQLGCL